jgi:basic membrane protein A and related proteins
LAISRRLLALGATAAIIFAACGPGTTASTAPTQAPPAATQSTSSAPPATQAGGDKSKYIACVAFDTGGLGDKNFNDLAFKGLEDAKAQGYTTFYAEAQGATDYAANIARLVDKGCKSVVTVGFLQSEATVAATALYPDVAFSQVDTAWTATTPHPDNFTGLDYQVDQAAMLAGYLAAGWSKSGKIGTYGGLAFAGVTRFMDGLYAGIQYYNQKHTTTVKLLGWDGALADPAKTGTFVGGTGGPDTWANTSKGQQFAQNFLNEGVDIIHPVAGATGNASIKGFFDAGKWAIGVDTDQWISLGDVEYHKALLTSAQKAIDVSVLDVINKNFAGDLGGEDYSGTIRNDGVLLAPYHDYDTQIPAELKAEIEQLRADLKDGVLSVCRFLGERAC